MGFSGVMDGLVGGCSLYLNLAGLKINIAPLKTTRLTYPHPCREKG